MYMGYIAKDDKKKKKNPEAIGEGVGETSAEKELTPEEQAALNQKAAEWQETLGVEAQPDADFDATMADVPPFDPAAAEAALAGTAVTGVIDAVAETPQANDDVENPNNENLRTTATVTEQVAAEQIKSNDISVSDLVQNVAGDVPGGQETIMQDANAAAVNMAQAEQAAKNLEVKVNDSDDGTTEGENVLNAAMVSAADMSIATEKAVVETVNEQAGAAASVAQAEEKIAQTSQLQETVQLAATRVENPELSAKMRTAVDDIEAELTRSRDLLTEATDTMAEEADAAALAEAAQEVAPETATPLLGDAAKDDDLTVTPESVNSVSPLTVNMVKDMKEQRATAVRQKAIEEATKIRAEQPTEPTPESSK